MSGTFGHPRLHLRRTDSTNQRARELALGGAPHGTLVTAAEQTSGRGRQGRRWSAPADSALLMSIVLRPGPPGGVLPGDEWPGAPLAGGERPGALLPGGEWPGALLPLAAGVAVCEVVGPEARVKWPNDVVVEHPAERGALAKLAGILVEGRPQAGWAVLGIGVNVAVRVEDLPPELHDTAATLGMGPEAIEPLLTRLLEALERRLGDSPEQTLMEWRARDALRGREIAWSGGRGRAEGVDRRGRLMVVGGGGERTSLEAGEVHLG